MAAIRIYIFVPTILLLFLSSVPSFPEGNNQPAPLTASDVGAFLDGFLPMQLEREDIAGAVVVIVKDGQILFAKGYGFSDSAKRKPVSVENTLFRPGSISKLFTWTSVMQLVEQGKLDLDRDINSYLDFTIPTTYVKPITLRNTMTHTSGFAETVKDLATSSAATMPPLNLYLKDHIPERIFPPGTTPAYSNYATALAGYVVSRVSGMPFEKYVDVNIFQPLGMSHSSFAQPLPKNLAPMISNGYKRGSDDPKAFEYITVSPAGSLCTSGADMSRFMIAHLQDGHFQDHQILRPETARMMHARQFGLDESLPGMALGFYEESRNGLRIIGHGGDTVYFHSDLHLIPEKNLGFFISYNSAGRGEISARDAVWEKFLGRYFPYTPPDVPKNVASLKSAKEVSGYYLISRRSDGNILHLLWRLLETHVTATKDGTIQISEFLNFNGKPKHWREIKPLVFQEVNGSELIVFHRGDNGKLRLLIRYPFMVMDKASWYENSLFLQILTIFSLSILAVTLVLWPVTGAIRKHYGTSLPLNPSEKRLRLITRLVCLIDLSFVMAFGVFLAKTEDDLSAFSTKTEIWIHLFQLIGAIGVLGTLFAVLSAYRFWSSRTFGIWTKLLHTLIALACVGFVWIVLEGHLLNFHLNY